MAGKPKFNPNQPFEVAEASAPQAKPAFDPNQPFEEVAQGLRPSPLTESTEEEPGLMSKALDYGTRALDYPGGFMRAGLANVAGLVSGRGSVVKPEDLKAAAKGQGPNSAEYLERLGVSEGPSVELPLVGKTSLRDAEGLALDIATDPLTAISKGVKAIRPGLAKLVRPLSEGAESAGKAAYKSGLKKVDEKLLEKGAKPVSELLLKEGKTGTTAKLAKDAEAIGKTAKADRAALYEQASKVGATVDMTKVLEKSTEAVAKMKADPGLRPTAEKLEELLNRYKEAGAIDLATASDWKTNLYNALPESAYDAHGKVKGPAAKVQKQLAEDFRKAIVSAGNAAEAGLGDKIDKLNETMQTTLTAKKPMAMQVRRAGTPNLVTSVDAMLAAGGGALTDPTTAVGLLAAKKAADAAKTTYVRTKGGKLLIDAGKSGLLDAVARRGLIRGKRQSLAIDEPREELLQSEGHE